MQTEVSEGVKRRRHLSEPAWLEVFKRFEDSGLTIEAFCRREGLGRSTFTRWRSRLLGQPARGGQPRTPSPIPTPKDFIDLGVVGARVSESVPALELRLDLGAGLTLTLTRR
jgi:transposase-like protein